MGIQHFLREIGRGAQGARALSREQAAQLWGQLLDDQVSALELGAFCVAMRIKGETPEEMAGFLDATQQRLPAWRQADGQCLAQPAVVVPSYNGARKLPNLTPLLAALLAREGLAVLVHGCASESGRVDTQSLWQQLQWPVLEQATALQAGQAVWAPTQVFSAALVRLLQVRRQIGLRNSAHALVKLLDPLAASHSASPPSLIVGNYTHPEYALSMGSTLALRQGHGLLLRGTEGEPVADVRRLPAMQAWLHGERLWETPAQAGSLAQLPLLPQVLSLDSSADHIQRILADKLPVPAPLLVQVQRIKALHLQLCQSLALRPQSGTGDKAPTPPPSLETSHAQ